jgi:exopolyphosphatase/guanosine-5'-triphosphate,3'-diphosphate pyrophosphatase
VDAVPDQRAIAHRASAGAAVYAALDLGTNNCRLLIARPNRANFRVVDGFSRIVRLGAGLEETGVLSETAMRRTVDALQVCADKMARRGVTASRAVATEACRRAKNVEQFFARVVEETGIALEAITWREEAELTLNGCRPLLDRAMRYALVFDVGGGSAELLWLKLNGSRAPDILGWESLPCGVVTLAERHGKEDYTPQEFAAAVDAITELLVPFEQRHRIRREIDRGVVQLLGTAGTVTTVAGVHLGLPRYNRRLVDGIWLELPTVRNVTHALARTTLAERVANPCIGPERADLVVAGCVVLEAVLRLWPGDRLRVADRGVREGILLALMDRGNGARHR